MATFERGAGDHVAERIRPADGTEEATRLEVLAADPMSDWRRIPDPEPEPEPDGPLPPPTGDQAPMERPAKSAPKADWLAYADAQDPADHSAMNKDALIEQYGKDEN